MSSVCEPNSAAALILSVILKKLLTLKVATALNAPKAVISKGSFQAFHPVECSLNEDGSIIVGTGPVEFSL